MGKFTQKTMKFLRDEGWYCGKDSIVERWVPVPAFRPGRKFDFLDCIDLIAMHPEKGKIAGVQSCGQDIAAHRKKIETLLSADNSPVNTWLACGGLLVLLGWRHLKKKRGGKARIWVPYIQTWQRKEGKLVSEVQK